MCLSKVFLKTGFRESDALRCSIGNCPKWQNKNFTLSIWTLFEGIDVHKKSSLFVDNLSRLSTKKRHQVIARICRNMASSESSDPKLERSWIGLNVRRLVQSIAVDSYQHRSTLTSTDTQGNSVSQWKFKFPWQNDCWKAFWKKLLLGRITRPKFIDTRRTGKAVTPPNFGCEAFPVLLIYTWTVYDTISQIYKVISYTLSKFSR